MKIIVPCAGRSSRFPNMRPKYLLTHPDGNMMVKKSIEGFNVEMKDVIITILKEHEEKYGATRAIKENLGNEVTVVILEQETKSQSETIYETLKRTKIDEPFLIKDSDNIFFFDHKKPRNYVCYSDIQEYEDINPGNKSYIKLNDQNIIMDIVEKRVISRFFNVGGYFFSSPQEFKETFEKLSAQNRGASEIYISHIIEDMIINQNKLFFGEKVKKYADFGTATQWSKYKSKYKTYFFDIDGILMKNSAQYTEPRWENAEPIKENLEIIKKLSQCPNIQIFFTTSRPESYRLILENKFKELGIKHDGMLMGCLHAKRIIIDDFSATTGYPKCEAINIMRDCPELHKYIDVSSLESEEIQKIIEIDNRKYKLIEEENSEPKKKLLEEKIDYLMLEPTNYCNLDCSFCNRSEIVKELKHMSLEEFREILEKIKYNPIRVAKLQGMGEPYLNPDFPAMCKLLKEYFPNIMLISATNCMHKDFEFFSEAMQYLDIQYLSIDGTKDNHERFRKGADWYDLINFLEKVSKQNFSKKCQMNFVATEYNYKDIPKLIELSEQYNLGELRINIAQNWNEDELAEFGNGEDMIQFLKQYKKYVKGKADWDFPECFWPFSGTYIDVFGNVRACCLNTSGESFGNLFKQSLDEIRNSEKFKRLQQNLKNNNPMSYCNTCDYKRLTPILKKIFED